MATKTTKPGASNFSWHKTGRAIDINQNHRWLITKEPGADGMRFRLYLEQAEGDAGPGTTFRKEDNPAFLSNPYGNKVYGKSFVDVTQALEEHGFSRISAQAGWERAYDKREWWHYEKRDGETMYAALRDVYTESDIVRGYSALVTNKRSGQASAASLVRLHHEGFPYETIQNISPKTPNAARQIKLSVAHSSLKARDPVTAALYLNGLNEPDIQRELKKLKPGVITALHAAAASHPGLGTGANIYRLTMGR
jgi:hypothetical protein